MTWPNLPASVPIAGLNGALSDYASKKFQGIYGWATDAPSGAGSAASLIWYYNATQYAVMARRDAGQTFSGLQTFAGGIADSSLAAGRVLFAGAAGRHSGSTHLSWDDTNRVLQIGGPSLDGRAVLDLWHYDGTPSAIRVYNPTSALGNNLGYDIDFRDSSGARQTYGRLLATIRDSTAGTHQGRSILQAAKAGTLTSYLRAGDLADLVGVGGEGVQVVAGSLFMGNSVLADSARNVTAGTVKTSGLLGASVSDEVLLGAAAGVLVFGASNGTSGARFRVNTAQTGSVLYRWQDSAGVAQMSLSPSGDLSILGGLKTGSGTERISSTGAFSGTTLGLTGKASLAASASGAASLNIPAGTAPTSPGDGDLWRDSSGVNARVFGTLPTRMAFAYPLFTGRRDVTVTTSDTAILPQIDLPANFWTAGRMVRVRFAVQANLTGARYFTVKFGAQTILQVQYDAGTWAGVVEFWVVCLSGGATARFAWAGRVDEQTNAFPVAIAAMGSSNADDGNWTADATGATSISVVQSVASGTRLQTVYFAQLEII